MKYGFKYLKQLFSKDELNFIFTILLIVSIFLLFRYTHLSRYVSVESLKELKMWIEENGAAGYIVYILFVIISGLVGVPALPIKFLGGLIFNPLVSIILITIGYVVSSIISFLIARYGMRGFIESMLEKNNKLKKIYVGFEERGWQMIMLTRSVPIFPYNLQNFAYGITNISLYKYTTMSLIFMLPANICISFLAHSISTGNNGLIFLIIYILLIAIIGSTTLFNSKNKKNS